MTDRRRCIIVAGPTCSGKSGLAMALASRLGGVVVNADAMQCYRDLRVLTARPSKDDERAVPHALYGVRAATEPATAAWWRREALALIEGTSRVPILCGGTGLYLAALVRGLADIPDPGPDARAEARGLLEQFGPAELYARLAQADPDTASRLRPTDGQRLARAWEVLAGTGHGLAHWTRAAAEAAPPVEIQAILLSPERAALRAAIDSRWAEMLNKGAIAEVAALRAARLDPALPLMRAHGVPELLAYLDGVITLDEAGRRATLAIGQYTKRQTTWWRHHDLTDAAHTLTIHARWTKNSQLSSRFMADMIGFVSGAD